MSDTKSTTLRLPAETWQRIVQACAARTIESGERVSAAVYIREAIEAALEQDGAA